MSTEIVKEASLQTSPTFQGKDSSIWNGRMVEHAQSSEASICGHAKISSLTDSKQTDANRVFTKADASQLSSELLSLGAAIVDYFFFVTEEQLTRMHFEKGSWSPISYEKLCNILQKNPEISSMVPGGSGVNVTKGVAQLGHHCAVIGKIGSDKEGSFFLKSMEKLGIDAYMQEGDLPTGRVVSMVTPDAERTMICYLGASHSLTDMELDDKLFKGVKIFHIEGYQLADHELVKRALIKAKNANVQVSMDLANTTIVREHKKFILEILREYVDVVLCNQAEALELTDLPVKNACKALASLCEIAVVTMSADGCWAQNGESLTYVAAYKVSAKDTTGAGDLFASGFLHGMLQGKPLKKCLEIGALVASYVVQVVGAEIPDQDWEKIREQIKTEDPLRMVS